MLSLSLKKWTLILVLNTVLIGCVGCGNSQETPDSRPSNTEEAPSSTKPEAALNPLNAASLNIELPPQWSVLTVNDKHYEIQNEQGVNTGFISAGDYDEHFEFKQVMPNHSSVIQEETFDIPLGQCRLVTLDADNGPAASGLTGTHNVYYAIIPVADKAIYIWSFTLNDQAEETKQLFIDLLNKLSLKQASS